VEEEGGSLTREGLVVVGIDGTANSQDALEWAVREAVLRAVPLEVLHVRTFRREFSETVQGAEEDEEAILDRAIGRALELSANVRVLGHVADPPAAEALIEESRRADLLVVGGRGLGDFGALALGSVSHDCARRSHCPVVIVRSAKR